MDERTRLDPLGWREQLLLTVIHWAAILGGVIAIGVTFRALFFGFIDIHHPAFAAMMASYGAIVALRLWPGLSYRARAIGFCAASFAAASSAVLLRGLAAAPVLLLGLNVLLVALFLGRTAMFGSLIAVSANVAIAGRPESTVAFSRFTSAVDIVCVAGVLTVLVHFVVSRLERSIQHSLQALGRLRAEQELRERAQADLSGAHAALQQTQKLDAVGRLAGGIAHDFNNTLQVVLGWTELLRAETDPELIHEGIQQIRLAAEKSRSLARQLLTFSRPELSTPKRVELSEFLRAFVESYRRLLPDDVSIAAHTTHGLAVLIDEGHLNQVLLNIVLNAREAMPTGGSLALTATLRRREELPSGVAELGADAIQIEVTDTGTGMDEDTLSRAFEPFFTTKGTRGTGLGLSTAYGVVQQAHGAIDIQSELGKGTTVRLFFPALTTLADVPAVAASSVPRVSTSQAVLLAEDDRDVRTTLARALRQAGHRVVEVGDAESGRVVIKEHGGEFTVLITDGIMPGGNTRQLIDDFLATRHDGRVIVCSGYFDSELSLRDLSAQTFDFVPKPFSPSELVSRLDALAAASSGMLASSDVTRRLH